ncbi:MAG: hypothetical protein FD153_1270 [Rhodospirillaceae bacterium]|nr:MAG: hypothetical protein FD153_1270 [Rhodospirillaceae bacterium]
MDGTEGGAVLTLVDPEVGDTVTVVPMMPVGTSVTPARTYPDLDLPATVRGIVVLPKVDKLNVLSSRRRR